MFKKIIVIVSSLVVLAGCNIDTKDSQPGTQQPTPTTAPTTSVSPTATPVPTPTSDEVSVDSLKISLKQGLTKDEVEKLLGRAYIELKGEDGPIWRYDFAIENYKFEPNSILVDEVDMNGLKKGSMKKQYFFHWQDNQLTSFALYYRNKDNKVEEYNVFGKGTVKTTPFN
ncbi:hypothetical protein [Paenibacillus sp. KN14-4R]|uniref:hypothetical protein n=1 Tax=Paenibacillus sp. KN14-4R TaxID=3445773 RepID=UPI003FA084E1